MIEYQRSDLQLRGSESERAAARHVAASICLRLNPDPLDAAAHLAVVLDALGLRGPATEHLTGLGSAGYFVGPQT